MGQMNNDNVAAFYRHKRILITGASGFIGWNLIEKLKQFECRITCMSRSIKGFIEDGGCAEIRFLQSEYHGLSEFQDAVIDVDVIYHLASQTSIYVAERDPIADYEANVKPMQLLLEACRTTNTSPVVVFSGTSTQCGMPKILPVSDDVEDHPMTVYDFNKLQAERLLMFYTAQGFVKGVSFRLTNVYGPGPKSSSADRGILNMMIKKALNGEDLTVYGDGKHIRDYIYVDDVVKAFLNAPMHIGGFYGRHCVLGSGEGTRIIDALVMVSNLVAKETGVVAKVKSVEPPPGLLCIESRDFVADTSCLAKQGILWNITRIHDGLLMTIGFLNEK